MDIKIWTEYNFLKVIPVLNKKQNQRTNELLIKRKNKP
jgi:hypothetical protein